MTWRNNLQEASFRGIPFYVDTSITGVGRRTEMHVYALSETGRGTKYQDYVWAKDLGAEPDSFSIEGYIIQNSLNGYDYFKERDELIKALKTKGEGKLIHPFFKEPMIVSLDGKATITEKLSSEGGIAKFVMNFVQFNKPIFSQLDTDYIGAVDKSVLDTINDALDNFTNLMNTAAVWLDTLTTPITQTINKMQTAIAATKGVITSTISTATGVISNSLNLIDTVLDSPCALINTIKDAGDSVLGLVGMAGEIVTGGIVGGCSGTTRGDETTLDGSSIPEQLGVSLTQNYAANADYEVSELDSVPESQTNNLDLVVVSTQTLMLANVIKMAIRVEYSSQEKMEETLTAITDSLDSLLERIGSLGDDIDDPLLFQSVANMRSVFVESMYAKNTSLTKEVAHEVPSGVMSTLELAYNQYEDVDRASEIFERNRGVIKHPGFMPSGNEVNILNE